MSDDAATLVAQAKQWASQYGDYSNGEKGAAYTAPLRVRAAWEANDPDAFAEMFIENGSSTTARRSVPTWPTRSAAGTGDRG
jgi:hypothetical protein